MFGFMDPERTRSGHPGVAMRRCLFLFLGVAWATVATAQDSAAGKSLYTAKCTACHGATGKGDGPAAVALPTKPGDLTSAEFWARITDDRLGSVIKNGTPAGIMRPFPMKDQEIADLVAYLRTFEPK
jgi:high-affinity iron transporter